MAVLTYTSTVYTNNQPKQVHVGNVTVSGQYNGSANTVGDVIFLAKIPNGAIIEDFRVDHSSGETALGLDYGLASGLAAGGGAQLSLFAAALTKGTTIRSNLLNATGTDKLQISCSVSDPRGFGIFGCKPVSGSVTTSYVVNFSITYRCDG